MSWIRTISDEDADARLSALYARVLDPRTKQLDHIMQVHSLHPRGLAAHHELYSAVMSGTKSLRKVERELIALVVSQENECHY